MAGNELDPFRVIVGVVAGQRNSDLLVELAAAAGLRFDGGLTDEEAYSHKTRVRALLPRIVSAYDELDPPNALGAASALIRALGAYPELNAAVTDRLRRVGWEADGDELVVADPDLREMFFPKGSRWDAYVVLRDLFSEPTNELIVVDPYCDGTVFRLLAARANNPVTVRILCGKGASALAGEAAAFVAQFNGWTNIQIRQGAKDFHDRFIVLDGTSRVHVGASINGAGKTAFMISKIEDSLNKDALLQQIESSWANAAPVA